MDVTTQRRCLGAIAGGLILGTAGAILWSLSGIDNPGAPPPSVSTHKTQPAITSDIQAPPADDRMAARRLRQPLYDPPAPPPAQPPKPPPAPVTAVPRPEPKLDVTLVGTIIQPQQSLAIVADSTGKFDVKGVGESLELSTKGITVQNIESEQVTLRYQGRQSTVKLDRSRKKKDDAGGSGGKKRGRRNR